MMHIVMHVKSTKRLPTHNVIYSIMQWYLKEMHEGLGFFYRRKGRVMHIAMHVKSTKRLPTHNVIYSIVQWYLKERHDLTEVPF